MNIDIHIHPDFLADNQKPEIVDKCIQLAQGFGIDKLCFLGDVLGYGYYPDENSIKKINDFTIATVKRYPDVLIGFCFLNPGNNKKFILEEIERCVVGEGFKGIKFEVSVNARSKKLDPIMERAEELNICVLQHTFYKMTGQEPNESSPLDIANLAFRFPRVKIIMAHLDGCGIRGVLDIQSFPNVYVDTSGSQPNNGMVEYAVEKIGAERVLYGSDAVGRDFSAQLGRIYGAKIKEKERELILGLNAQRILRLK